jgi:Cu(I)/Ag(I) efflux system periplasmic protein CusF
MIKHLSIALAGALLAASAFAQVELADGEVRKVDKAIGKITLKHGDIKSLDMPPMTMVFGVKDKSLLDNVKAGDKIRFSADKDATGQIIVTGIEPTK